MNSDGVWLFIFYQSGFDAKVCDWDLLCHDNYKFPPRIQMNIHDGCTHI